VTGNVGTNATLVNLLTNANFFSNQFQITNSINIYTSATLNTKGVNTYGIGVINLYYGGSLLIGQGKINNFINVVGGTIIGYENAELNLISTIPKLATLLFYSSSLTILNDITCYGDFHVYSGFVTGIFFYKNRKWFIDKLWYSNF
jgi:hypothetical protein